MHASVAAQQHASACAWLHTEVVSHNALRAYPFIFRTWILKIPGGAAAPDAELIRDAPPCLSLLQCEAICYAVQPGPKNLSCGLLAGHVCTFNAMLLIQQRFTSVQEFLDTISVSA